MRYAREVRYKLLQHRQKDVTPDEYIFRSIVIGVCCRIRLHIIVERIGIVNMHGNGKRVCAATVVALLLASSVPLRAQDAGEEVLLSAGKAVEMAMNNNRTLMALDHQLRATDYSVKSAVTGFLPKVSVSGTYTRQGVSDAQEQMMRAFGVTDDLANSFNAGLDIKQPIFTGFATLNALRSAQTSRTLQEATNETTAQTIRYAVLQIYWGLVNLEKTKAVSTQAVKQLEELSANQSAMLEQGMSTEHDQLLTDASLAQARFNEIAVEKSILSLKRQFAILLGLPVGSRITLTDTTTATVVHSSENVDSIVKSALENRPDLREMKLQDRLAELGVRLTRSSCFPTLAAGFSYTESRPEQIMQSPWYAYTALSFDLFDWGDRIFKIRKAKEERLSLLSLLEQKRATVEKEVMDAWQATWQASKELEVATILVGAREKAYQASVAKYEEGIMPMYELLDAHSDLISARKAVLQAATDLELARIDLEMGGLGSSSSNSGSPEQ